MLEGGYEFKTASRELIEIHSGRLNVKIAGNKDWTLNNDGKINHAGFEIEVGLKSKFIFKKAFYKWINTDK
tara:strand:- start:45 stop:257 length:213 start_codon:yes stop_codon:yes gene_type:complete